MKYAPDLFQPHPVRLAYMRREQFTEAFLDYLPANVAVFAAFEREALTIIRRGFVHYSARTIIEVLRHHSALAEVDGKFKLDNDFTPGLARLFGLAHPEHADLFALREAKTVRREREGVTA